MSGLRPLLYLRVFAIVLAWAQLKLFMSCKNIVNEFLLFLVRFFERFLLVSKLYSLACDDTCRLLCVGRRARRVLVV